MLRLWVCSFLITGLFAQDSLCQAVNKVKLDSLLDALAVHDRVMMSMAISQNGVPVYRRAIGYSKIDGTDKTAATTQTRYRIGSISKVFTAVMIFQLIEEKKLQLTTTLAEYFPNLPNAGKITVANMLNHSSGLHNFTDDSSYMSIIDKQMSHEDMLARFNVPPDFEPGSKHQYSNTNFFLLGYIVEKLDKKVYAAALKDRIVLKIDLKDTYYGGKIGSQSNEAYPYAWNGSWQPDTETDMSIPGGAGALVSTPADLTTFIYALFTGRLVSDSSLNKMKTIKDGYGMPLFAIPFYSRTSYGHNGGIDGFRSQVAYYPDDKIAIAYTANGVNTNLNDMMIGALSMVFNRPYTIPSYTATLLKPEDLDKYLGVYASEKIPLKITVTKNGAVLVAQATGQGAFNLEAAGTNEFKFDAAGIVLTFDPVNNQMTLKQGGGSFLFTKEK